MKPIERTVFETRDQKPDTKTQRTADGFQNFAAKIGVAPRGTEGSEENLISQGHYEFNLVTRNRIQLEAAYRGSWIVGQVVDTFAEDMTRAGIDITTNDGAEEIQKLKVKMSRLQIWQSLCSLIKWSRLYGGAIAVLQIKGDNLEDPIDPDSIEEGAFQGLSVYDRWQLYPVLSELIEIGPEMGLPKYYDIVLGSNLNDPGKIEGAQVSENPHSHVRVHHSRCVRMEGIHLPFFQAITEMLWGESVLERMWDRLIAFDDATMNTAGLIHRALLRSVGIANLREILAAGGQAQEALVQQFEMMRTLQSNEGITLIDKEDAFATTAYSFSGLSDVMIQMGQQVSGACNPPIPLVRLFGQSPVGMSATGESDIRLYYDGVNAHQEAKLRNPLELILKIMWRSMTGQPAPKDLSFEFTPLWQMSASDKATIAKTNTDTIIEAHQEGAIDTATMMKELKQASGDNGLFTHITDEMIEEAESEIPPEPNTEGQTPSTGVGNLGENPAQTKELIKKKVGDAWRKIRDWIKDAAQSRRPNGQFGTGSGSSHKESYRGHHIEVKESDRGHKASINGKEIEGNFSGPATAVHRAKTLIERNTSAYDDGDENRNIRMIRDFINKKTTDPGMEGTMREFAKGTLKTSAGKKVTSRKQAIAIGYSQERRGK
jgi:phage-related protein (TIGR01555 family)